MKKKQILSMAVIKMLNRLKSLAIDKLAIKYRFFFYSALNCDQ